jgi:hypothetical protein
MIKQPNRNSQTTRVWCSIATAIGVLAFTSAPAALIPGNHNFDRPGNLLIADQFNNRVIETDPLGNIVWQFGHGPNDFTSKSIIGVNDAERVGEFTLMAGTGTPAGVVPEAPDGFADNRVMLVDPTGRVVWQYGQFGQTGSGFNQLSSPVQSTWLPYSQVLITDQGNNRVIAVNLRKQIVWQYPGSNTNDSDQLASPNSAELLANGHVLIADENNDRVLEVTHGDVIVNTYTAGGTLGAVAFASSLNNGDTLITDGGNNRVVEVDSDDNIVWEYDTNLDPDSIDNPAPSRAVQLANGDTLISDQFNNRVIRVNHDKEIVAYYGLSLDDGNNTGYDTHTAQNGLYAPYDAKVIDDYTGLTPPGSIHF